MKIIKNNNKIINRINNSNKIKIKKNEEFIFIQISANIILFFLIKYVNLIYIFVK